MHTLPSSGVVFHLGLRPQRGRELFLEARVFYLGYTAVLHLVDSSLDGGRWVIAGSLGSYDGAWFKKVKKTPF